MPVPFCTQRVHGRERQARSSDPVPPFPSQVTFACSNGAYSFQDSKAAQRWHCWASQHGRIPHAVTSGAECTGSHPVPSHHTQPL